MFRLLGVYDYTVILTYIGLISAVVGMVQAVGGNCLAAVCCLAFSGVCDAFDGRIARTKKDRTEDEKSFGIQLDSLCDVVCFGVLPGLIGHALGMKGALGIGVIAFYCLCAVIRLAFFNVLETKRQQTEGGCNKIYRGLPVTSIALLMPLTFGLQYVLPETAFLAALHLVLAVVGFLFILDFPIRKPKLETILMLIGVGAAAIGLIFILKFMNICL